LCPGENLRSTDWAATALRRRSSPWRRRLGTAGGGRSACVIWSAGGGVCRLFFGELCLEAEVFWGAGEVAGGDARCSLRAVILSGDGPWHPAQVLLRALG
jgi:hypothetical protein